MVYATIVTLLSGANAAAEEAPADGSSAALDAESPERRSREAEPIEWPHPMLPEYHPGAAPPKMLYPEGAPIPPGYHLEERPRKGPLITGYALGVGTYTVGVFFTGVFREEDTGWLLIPLAGPWISMEKRSQRCDRMERAAKAAANDYSSDYPDSSDHDPDDLCGFAPFGFAFFGLMQGAGALLILIGYTATKTWLVRDDVAGVSVRPVRIGKDGYGGAFVGVF